MLVLNLVWSFLSIANYFFIFVLFFSFFLSFSFTCNGVLYNIFIRELFAHFRSRVVVNICYFWRRRQFKTHSLMNVFLRLALLQKMTETFRSKGSRNLYYDQTKVFNKNLADFMQILTPNTSQGNSCCCCRSHFTICKVFADKRFLNFGTPFRATSKY